MNWQISTEDGEQKKIKNDLKIFRENLNSLVLECWKLPEKIGLC